MYKIAVYNSKGGIGKTTLSVNLATSLSALGYNVLLLDLDSQTDATSFFQLEQETIKNASIYNVIFNKKSLEDTIYKISNNLSVLSSTRYEDINHILYNKNSNFLTKILESVETKYDFCIIDCAPTENSVNAHICFYADEILLISQPEYLSVKAISNVYNHMKKHLKKDKIHTIVLNKVRSTKEHMELIELVKDIFKEKTVFTIRDRISIANSIRTQKSFYNLKDKDLEEEFNLLLKEIIERWMH